jgi:Protein of unknown function (DUF3592)
VEETNKPARQRRGWIPPLLFIVGGIGLAILSALDLNLYYQANEADQNWKVTTGILTKAEGVHYKSRKSPNGYWELDVLYQYTADGQQYTGDRYRLSGSALDEQRFSDISGRWRVGAPIQIAYNPSRPTESCIKETLKYGAIIRVPTVAVGVIGLGLTLYGILRMGIFWLTRRSQSADSVPPEAPQQT